MSASPYKGTLPAPRVRGARYLYSPTLDFILLGGESLIGLAVILVWMAAVPDPLALSVSITLLLANGINHPHFAHSYQIFYGNFRAKLTLYPAPLRRLCWLSGVIVPLLLAGLLAAPVLLKRPDALGLAVNAMGFFVGWHYVKQGYGMAMVDAVLKRAFFTDVQKRLLLHNAYAVWVASWLLATT